MSHVNIKRLVENIKSNTTIFTPIIEAIVNSIQAIEQKGAGKGIIEILVYRSPQIEQDNDTSAIEDIVIIDNGVGFNQKNRDSFDTLYSDHKIKIGGKGFGRFTCLKYFENLHIDSIFLDEGTYKRRSFSMGKQHEIIVKENIEKTQEKDSKTELRLAQCKSKNIPKKLSTIARSLVEKLLPYFITKDYECPQIILSEADRSEKIILNSYIKKSESVILEIPLPTECFSINSKDETFDFQVRSFKIYSPKNQKSKISLVAHKREVTETPIHNFIPEFIDEFYDIAPNNDGGRNYIIKTYVFGKYLDDNVSLERGSFEFQKEEDFLYGVSQTAIEKKAAEITEKAINIEIASRQEKKRLLIVNYIDTQAPWHKSLIEDLDLHKFPYNPTNEEIEAILQREKYELEIDIKKQLKKVLKDNNHKNIQETVVNLVTKIATSSKNDLIHYIALRKTFLDLFKKTMEVNNTGSYESEESIHRIIFPTKSDSDHTSYKDHNLWIIDERLNFTNFLSSDLPLSKSTSDRPDLLIYNQRIAFRSENETSNPVTVFEFKRPGRDDFVNTSAKEDPVQQIIRYVNNIRSGKFKTPEGRNISISSNTPFYGYVICDITEKVEYWLTFEKNFKPMPDRLGWFQWLDNLNLYVEVLSWDKILKDATMRNKIFFHTLGL
ncbi:ATP-binding protein [Pseudomonas sp. LTJR-52]|uniref:ATP-binding protein n=1 Tax=Pseudomonas sp. LTJR-52 TaxID=2479392 RepID=UPI000EFDA975|nr:ATP-binding protein [Pseudomonas sp. LTJR-52]AYN92570.1 ATP-binding protein [Pseudomonas sp. LTJR-52]